MILIVSDKFPFNFIFTSENFRILAPIYFIYINHFMYFKLDFRIKISYFNRCENDTKETLGTLI